MTFSPVINGISQSITFPAQVTIIGNKAEAKVTFDVGHTKYDIKFHVVASLKT